MNHKVAARKSEHGSERERYGRMRTVTLITKHIITYSIGRESVTLRSERTRWGSLLPQKVVESASRSGHPLDADVGLAPLLLEVGLQQVRHAFHEIQRTTIAKVQAGIEGRHRGIVA